MSVPTWVANDGWLARAFRIMPGDRSKPSTSQRRPARIGRNLPAPQPASRTLRWPRSDPAKWPYHREFDWLLRLCGAESIRILIGCRVVCHANLLVRLHLLHAVSFPDARKPLANSPSRAARTCVRPPRSGSVLPPPVRRCPSGPGGVDEVSGGGLRDCGGLGVGVERAAGQPPVEEQSQGSGERPRVARWNTLARSRTQVRTGRLVRDRAVVHRGAGPRLGRGVDEGAAAVALAATGVRQRGMACGSFGVRARGVECDVEGAACQPQRGVARDVRPAVGDVVVRDGGSRSAWKLPALTAAAAPADSSRVTGTASAIFSSCCMMNPSTLKAAPSVHAHPPHPLVRRLPCRPDWSSTSAEPRHDLTSYKEVERRMAPAAGPRRWSPVSRRPPDLLRDRALSRPLTNATPRSLHPIRRHPKRGRIGPPVPRQDRTFCEAGQSESWG